MQGIWQRNGELNRGVGGEGFLSVLPFRYGQVESDWTIASFISMLRAKRSATGDTADQRCVTPGLEQAVDGDAEDAERALVFEAFGGFVEFLQGELGVLEEGSSLTSLPTEPWPWFIFSRISRRLVMAVVVSL